LIYKEHGALNEENLSYKTIKIPLSTLNLKGKEIHFDTEDKLSENNHILKCLIDNFFYIPPQDKNSYFYVNDKK